MLTTTAYPPSTGGVQAHVEELRRRLKSFEADVVTMWLRNRTDWLLGTTLRLVGPAAKEVAPGVTALAWSRATRARMAPWVASYYTAPRLVAKRIAAEMVPYLDGAISPDHVLIHNHRIGREFLAQASLEVARRRGIPFVLTPHHHPKWRGRRYAGWTDVYRAADAVLVLTNTELKELERLGVDSRRIHVIGSAADPPQLAHPKRFLARIGGTSGPIVLFLGQQYEYKGVAELVAAVDSLRLRGVDCELVFLGPPTPFSTRFFAKHSRPWLHVLGIVDEQTKWDAIEASTVVCLPSRHEAFGRVFLEAWSKSKPVIGGRIPAVQEVVTEGQTGLLVDPRSSEELAGALEQVLTGHELAARLGANGAREVAGRFSWDTVIGRVESVYQSLLEKEGSS
ncbi:MAG: glycosyltransferase family 4 protein [Candidatus Dormibacterales bacterium]